MFPYLKTEELTIPDTYLIPDTRPLRCVCVPPRRALPIFSLGRWLEIASELPAVVRDATEGAATVRFVF